MSSVRPITNPANHPTATAQPLLLGAYVHLHMSPATGVVIGYSPERDRVLVRWDDSGEVTRCLRAKLAPVL
jgi:hypothetical protein